MRAVVRRLQARLGRRGTILLILGVGKICFGVGVIAEPPSIRGLDLLLRYAPLCAWAMVWIAAGVVVVVAAFLPVGADRGGFIVALIPPMIWAVAYGTAAAEGIYPRGWFVAGWFLTSHIGVISWAGTVPEHSVPHSEQQGHASE